MSAVVMSDREVAHQRRDRGAELAELSDLEARVVDAAMRCIARWGVAKTTLDDVARDANCSRATVYRAFPGGKDALLDRAITVELARHLAALDARLAATTSLDDLLVVGITETARTALHHPALRFVLQHEPEAILPRLSFHRFDDVLRLAVDFAAPHLERWLEPTEARRAAEWVTRIVASYVMSPSEAVDVEDDESVRQLVRTFILPGLTRNEGERL